MRETERVEGAPTSTRRLAVVTGASSGIGAEFARRLASRGYDLVLVARRRERLEDLAAEITSKWDSVCEPIALNLTNEIDLISLENRLSRDPDLSLLVNNAGFDRPGLFHTTQFRPQDTMHRLHVIAVMRLCHAALPGMIQRNAGAIINVSSISGFVINPGSTSYCATKAWMNSFTEGLALELKAAKSAVTVQALCPGFTRTEFHQAAEIDASGVPKWMWHTPELVVRWSLEGLDRHTLFVVPGFGYRLAVSLYSILPRSARHRLGKTGFLYRASESRTQDSQ